MRKTGKLKNRKRYGVCDILALVLVAFIFVTDFSVVVGTTRILFSGVFPLRLYKLYIRSYFKTIKDYKINVLDKCTIREKTGNITDIVTHVLLLLL